MNELEDAEQVVRELSGREPVVSPELLKRMQEADPRPTPRDIERARELTRELGLDRKPDGSK